MTTFQQLCNDIYKVNLYELTGNKAWIADIIHLTRWDS